ncbi:uncharacterized protein B0I36DRAFT_350954 [Microdochium trichocladiopsis]|uniref:Uncharacterized protein n=1 Tax=Microdochium trichocladiopsis TaxID=1682393 RepID=A0A9P8Y1E6_9PEZI|nr:uncharacterized protein B0I36DRAFT_350954 [Microdochium trichocladiopsis]KAH7027422.1 hypothetical protein B0I36DRAFT_350954 [Microdochium trichocladiopsis]
MQRALMCSAVVDARKRTGILCPQDGWPPDYPDATPTLPPPVRDTVSGARNIAETSRKHREHKAAHVQSIPHSVPKGSAEAADSARVTPDQVTGSQRGNPRPGVISLFVANAAVHAAMKARGQGVDIFCPRLHRAEGCFGLHQHPSGGARVLQGLSTEYFARHVLAQPGKTVARLERCSWRTGRIVSSALASLCALGMPTGYSTSSGSEPLAQAFAPLRGTSEDH